MFKKLIQSKALRSRTAWLITAVLILPFLLFFHFSGGPEGAPGGAAGSLFGQRVPWDRFDAQRRWVRLQWALQFGQIPESLEPMVDGYTWDRLLLIEAARREGLRVSDRELAGFIQGMPSFQDQGRFVPDRYYEFLASLGSSPSSFERLIRQDLMVERLTTRIKDRVQVTDDDVRQAHQDAGERRGVALLSWPAEAFAPSEATLTDEAIAAHYRAREALITQPGRVTVELIGATREHVSTDLVVTDEQVQRYYDEHPEEFTADGLPAAPDAQAKSAAQEAGAAKPLAEVRPQIQARLTQEAAKKRLTALAVDLDAARKEGQAFEAIAESLTLPVTRQGPYEIGNLFVVNGPDPTVLQAAFALTQPGQVSDVIENDRGAHLLRLVERRPERIPPLEEVREMIVQDLLDERGHAIAQAAAEQARAALTERLAAGTAFEDAAKALTLSPASPVPFTRTEPVGSLGQAPALTSAVFATPAQQLTPVTEAAEGFAVAYVREVVPADAAGLTEAQRAELRAQVTEQRQQAELTQWMEQLRAKATPKSFLEGTSALGP